MRDLKMLMLRNGDTDDDDNNDDDDENDDDREMIRGEGRGGGEASGGQREG